MTSERHRAYLSLGSNIEPERHLREAVRLLRQYGEVEAVSSAWESHAVGAVGPNFVNACVLLLSPVPADQIVEGVIRPIEALLGRVRTADRYAPRPIDIDLVLYDDQPMRLEYWEQAFTIVPLAELAPAFRHPVTGEPLSDVARRLRTETWIQPRPDVMQGLETGPGSVSDMQGPGAA